MEHIEFFLENEAQTESLAGYLRHFLHPKDIVFLKGNMGSGKSTFVRNIIQRTLGKNYSVPSPTFSIFQLHDTHIPPVLHADLYRLEDAQEVYELGFEEYFSSHLFFIEWPDRLPEKYMTPSIIVNFKSVEGNKRYLCLEVPKALGKQLLEKLKDSDLCVRKEGV